MSLPSGTNFAGTVVEIDGQVVAKVTSFELSNEIDELEVTGSEDTVGTAPNKISEAQYIASQIARTANIGGISLITDTGQSDIEDAADTGKSVTIRQYNQGGNGYMITGFFTSFTRTGELGSVYTFDSAFRINSKSTFSGSAS